MHWRFSLANLCFLHLGVKKDNSHILMRLTKIFGCERHKIFRKLCC